MLSIVPAVPSGAIGVDPTRFIFLAETGKTYDGKFTVLNDQDHDMQVDIEVNKGIDSGENVNIISDSGWLAPDARSFIIAPRGKKDVNFTVTVPNGTAGTFSAKISFIDRSSEAFSSSVTIPVYVVIKGTEIIDWEADAFDVAVTPAGTAAAVKVNNRGNVHFYVTGRLRLTDGGRREVWSVAIGGGKAVFPRSQAILPVDASKLDLKNGKYEADIELKGYSDETKHFKYLLHKKGSKYTTRRL